MGELAPPPPPLLELELKSELLFVPLPPVSMLLRWQLVAIDIGTVLPAATSEEEDGSDAETWSSFASPLLHAMSADAASASEGIKVPVRAAIKLGEFKTASGCSGCSSGWLDACACVS